MTQDSPDYPARKQFYNHLLTVYGRKPAPEALQSDGFPCFRLHLVKSNRSGGIIADIIRFAESRVREIVYHGPRGPVAQKSFALIQRFLNPCASRASL